MAVLTSLPGLSVEVLVGKNPLREYVDTEAVSSAKETSSYVEVETEAPFEIKTKFSDEFTPTRAVRLELRIDGIHVTDYILRKNELQYIDCRKAWIESKIAGRWHLSDLLFAAFATGE